MEHMGHLLKRDARKDADPRVNHFIPDTWQVCTYSFAKTREKLDLLAWKYFGNKLLEKPTSIVYSMEMLPWYWYGNILEILWRYSGYSGNKTSILWQWSSFSIELSWRKQELSLADIISCKRPYCHFRCHLVLFIFTVTFVIVNSIVVVFVFAFAFVVFGFLDFSVTVSVILPAAINK